jgi:phosphate transport system permease protein
MKGASHPGALFGRSLVYFGALVTGVLVMGLLGYILAQGIPKLRPSLFAWQFTTENQSMLPAILNTLVLSLLTLLLAVPAGVGGAIYLVEYGGGRLGGLVELAAEALQGIPSIVYGLFGFAVFGTIWGFSLLSGAITLAMMVLPLVLRTTQEALRAVPDAYREGSFGLGAGKLRTVFRIVLPAALPGILSGISLSIGRIVGESAALIYTAGTGTGNLNFQKNGKFSLTAPLFQSTRTLAVHMYALMNEGLYVEEAQATAVVLLGLVLALNALNAFWGRKLRQRS